MKKIAALAVVLIFVFAVNCYALAGNVQGISDPGVYLKKIGIVQGFPDGSLNENGYITQAQYLSLLARMLRKVKTVKRGNLVKQTNFFDRLINKAYHAYLILKYKLSNLYYKINMYIYSKQKGTDKNAWYFKDLVYLQTNGFDIPKGFKPDAVISEGYAVNWAMKALGLGISNEYIIRSKDVEDGAVSFTLSVEHDMALDGLSTAKPLKRRDAFNLILKIIK